MDKQKDNEFQAVHFSQVRGFRTLYVVDTGAKEGWFRPREEVFAEMGFEVCEDFMLPQPDSYTFTGCRRYVHADGREILETHEEAPIFVDDYAEFLALKLKIASTLSLSVLLEKISILDQELEWLVHGKPSQAAMVFGDFAREGHITGRPSTLPARQPRPMEPADVEYIRKRRLRESLVELPEHDDEDNTHINPDTGERHIVCDNCDLPMNLEEMHSGGFCNLCHAMAKDD
jgi:hypothetical protein